MIRKDLSTGGGESLSMLLETGQYGEIALIEHGIAVPMDIAGTSSFLLFGSTVLGDRSTRKQKRQGTDEKHIPVHGNLSR